MVQSDNTEEQRRGGEPANDSLESALSASEERFRGMLESHPSAVLLVDESGRIVWFNARTAALLGYEAGELTGLSVDQLVPDALRSGHVGNRAGYMLDPQPRRMGLGRDLAARRKDGTLVPVEIGLSSFVSDGERLVVAVMADITARKAAEEDLASIADNLAALIAASPLATLALDLDGRVTLWNPACEQMFGWKADEVLGRVLPHVPASELAEVREIIARVAAGEVIRGVELSRQRKDGEPVLVELYAAPKRNGSGVIVGVLEQLADVTGRRRLEEALLQTQKMESIGRLAGGIAHDFNNMLTAIRGFAQLVLADLPADSRDHHNVEAIDRAARQAATLTQQLLAFSRKQVLDPQILDPNVSITQMESMLRRLIGEDVDLRINLKEDPGHIKVDPAQLEQVVMNLVINARDAMPSGGSMTIETGRSHFDSAYASEHFAVLPGDYVMVAVGDNGVGMDKATRAHVFEPFFTTKQFGKGTGLGLATVYGIVRQSGGHIWLYSEPGEGTTFKIYFPLVNDPVTESEPPPIVAAGGSEIILLVEDEDVVRELAQVILERSGYRVLVAPTPREALASAESHSGTIDILISDVIMPVMSGPELARRVREIRPTIRTLFLSGYTEELVNADGRLAGMDGFLSKPFTAEELTRKVGEILVPNRAVHAPS